MLSCPILTSDVRCAFEMANYPPTERAVSRRLRLHKTNFVLSQSWCMHACRRLLPVVVEASRAEVSRAEGSPVAHKDRRQHRYWTTKLALQNATTWQHVRETQWIFPLVVMVGDFD